MRAINFKQVMRNTLVALLITVTHMGCTEKPNNNEEGSSPGFGDFVDHVPAMALPLTITCGFDNTITDSDFKHKYQSHVPKDMEVVGKLKTENDISLVFFARVEDLLYPFLYSFDKDGNVIDSLYLHVKNCAADPYIELFTWSVIQNDLTINMTDTAKHYNYIEYNDGYSRDLDSIVVTKRHLQIDRSGNFTNKREEREVIIPDQANNPKLAGSPTANKEFIQGDVRFVFSKLTDPEELGLYQRFEAQVSDSTQVILESDLLELDGLSFAFNELYVYSTDSSTLFLITANNRPEPNFYFVLKKTGKTIELIGQTEPTTKVFFEDIDGDGYVEIGGFNTHCQGINIADYSEPNFCMDHYRVFEIQDSITRDWIVEDEQRELLIKRRN